MPRGEIRRFDPELPIEKAHTPPYTWYTDPKIFDEEKHQIFEKSWLAVGRADQVDDVGNYFTGQVAGNPYVVVRGDDGELRAFHNVCRHHAAEVAQECGSCRELVCPYHGWTYRLDGSLRRAPRMGKMSNFDPKRYGLTPISVGTWGPFVLIDLDGPFGGRNNPRELELDIGPLKQPLEELGLDQMKWVERRVYQLNCNWKVFVDNSLDGGYHVAYAHEGLAQGLEFAGYETEIHDRSAIQICDTSGQDSRLGNQVIYAWLFPNFFINRYGNMMDTNLVMPLTADTCEVIFDFYFNYENFEEWEVKRTIRKAIDESDVIQHEDVTICESAQRGMRSMAFQQGLYSEKLERAVHAFHVMLWKELLGQGA
jgi:choline monooxygenase